jgi:hypothetical protein
MNFYMVQSMTYVYMIKPKWLHFTLICLDEFTIQMILIYRDREMLKICLGLTPMCLRVVQGSFSVGI